MDKDKRGIIASARDEARTESQTYSAQVGHLTDEIATLRERDRLHLEEIRRLMMDKIEMQASGLEQGAEALERERRLNDMRESLEAKGVPFESQGAMIEMQQRIDTLTSEVATLTHKLRKTGAFIKNQDALFRADEQRRVSGSGTPTRLCVLTTVAVREHERDGQGARRPDHQAQERSLGRQAQCARP